jgi:hypothetical protein
MIVWAPDCLATLCLLRKVRVPALHIEHVRNAAEMSNYGNKYMTILISIFILFLSRYSTCINIE